MNLNTIEGDMVAYKGDVTLVKGCCVKIGSGNLHINKITQARRYTYIGDFPQTMEKVIGDGEWCCKSANPGFSECCEHYKRKSEDLCKKASGHNYFECKHTEDFKGSGCFDFLAGTYIVGWTCLKPSNVTWTVYQIRPDSESVNVEVSHNLTSRWVNETVMAGAIKQLDNVRINVLGNIGLVPPNYIAVRKSASGYGSDVWYGCENIFDKTELCRSTHWNDIHKLVDTRCVQPKWEVWPGRTEFRWTRNQFVRLFPKFRELVGAKQVQIQYGSSVLLEFPAEYVTLSLEARFQILSKHVSMCEQVQRVKFVVRSATVDDSYQLVEMYGYVVGRCRLYMYVSPCLKLGDVSIVVENSFMEEMIISCGAILPSTFKVEYAKHASMQVEVKGLQRNWTAAWQTTYSALNLTEALAEKYIKGIDFSLLSRYTSFLNFDVFSVISSLGTRIVHYLFCAIFGYLGFTSLLGGNMVFAMLFTLLGIA
jgi:hypothetical protein